MRIGDMAQHADQIDARRRAVVRAHLDARERQEIVDQPPHPARLVEHDAKELFRSRRVVAGRAKQRLDEAGQRGERRAQFMTGVGDEVGAHARDREAVGDVVEGHEDETDRAARRAKRTERHGVGRGRLARLAELDGGRLSGAGDLERLGEFRAAEGEREGVARARRREELLRRCRWRSGRCRRHRA